MRRIHNLLFTATHAMFGAVFLVGPAGFAAPQELSEISIPFQLNSQSNMLVRATLNNEDSLLLMLHTAASDLMITEDAVRQSKSIKFVDSVKMKSWGGEANSRVSRGNTLQFGKLTSVGVSIFEDKNSGKDSDGKFGLDLFKERIVEIDFDVSAITLHEFLPKKAEQFERLKIENRDGMLFVQGSLLIDNKSYNNSFLIHSGYSGGLLLDDAFAERSGVDDKIKITDESSLKDSFGNTIRIKKGIVPMVQLGNVSFTDVPIGFFAGAIGAQKMSLVGCEVLTKFHFILDIANGDLYLAARSRERANQIQTRDR